MSEQDVDRGTAGVAGVRPDAGVSTNAPAVSPPMTTSLEPPSEEARVTRDRSPLEVLVGFAATIVVFWLDRPGERVGLALACALALAVTVRVWRVSHARQKVASRLDRAVREQERLAITDALTALHNRRFFEEVLSIEVEVAVRRAGSLGVILLDLDHFKQINDCYGHGAGDAVLREAARRLSMTVRASDVIARFGGEEFVVLARDADPTLVGEIAERLRETVAAEPFQVGSGRELPVTISVGAACLPDHAGSSADLVRIADQALYRAKRLGRNQVQVGVRRSGQIGLYCPFLAEVPGGFHGAGGYYMELAIGAAEAAQREGLALALFPCGLTAEELAEIDIDGLIVADPLLGDPVVRRLAALGRTIVTCERDPTPGVMHAGCVRSDHTEAINELLAHIRAAGATRPALIIPGEESAWSHEVATAYRAWCQAHHITVLAEHVPITPVPEHAMNATRRLLERGEPPDAILCAPDGSLGGVLRALSAKGLRIPQDILVAACCDGAEVRVAQPPVTAIDLQPNLVGRRAAEILAGLLAKRATPGIEEMVQTRLAIRESTCPPSLGRCGGGC